MMITIQNNRPPVRVYHQGCVSNIPDEQNQKHKKIIKYKNKKITKSNKSEKNYIKHSGRQ